MTAIFLQFYANNSIAFIHFFSVRVLWGFLFLFLVGFFFCIILRHFVILLLKYSQYVYVREKHHDSMCK